MDEGTIVNWTLPDGYSDWTASVVHSSNCNGVIALDMYQGKYLLFGAAPGTLHVDYLQPGRNQVDDRDRQRDPEQLRWRAYVEYRAVGNKGGEQVYLLRAGKRVSPARTLTTAFQTFRQTVYGEGDIGIEFVNDDAVSNGKAARVDYLSVDGVRRETEAQAVNTGSYANNKCGGGSYSEWLYCAGAVNYGPLNQNHTIRIRARGTAGGEHIHLLINGHVREHRLVADHRIPGIHGHRERRRRHQRQVRQ